MNERIVKVSTGCRRPKRRNPNLIRKTIPIADVPEKCPCHRDRFAPSHSNPPWRAPRAGADDAAATLQSA
jgi:hypothetical protein